METKEELEVFIDRIQELEKQNAELRIMLEQHSLPPLHASFLESMESCCSKDKLRGLNAEGMRRLLEYAPRSYVCLLLHTYKQIYDTQMIQMNSAGKDLNGNYILNEIGELDEFFSSFDIENPTTEQILEYIKNAPRLRNSFANTRTYIKNIVIFSNLVEATMHMLLHLIQHNYVKLPIFTQETDVEPTDGEKSPNEDAGEAGTHTQAPKNPPNDLMIID